MLRTTTALALTVSFAAPAAAQELSFATGAFDIKDISTSDGGLNAQVTDFLGEAEFAFNNIVLGAGMISRSFSGDGPTYTVTSLRASAGYMITPEAYFGASLTSLSFDDFEEITGYQVFGQYETAQFGIGGRYQVPDSDDTDFTIVLVGAEAELTPGVTISATTEKFTQFDESSYHIAGQYDAGSYFARAFYANDSSFDFGFAGARGGYRFTDAIALTAGYLTLTGDTPAEFRSYTIGGSYEFWDGVTADVNYVTYDNMGPTELKSVSLAITYELGQRKRLDERLFNTAREDLQGGIFIFNPYTDFGLVGFGPG